MRPTVADYINAFGGVLPEKNPYSTSDINNFQTSAKFREDVIKVGKILVFLAKFYDNYTFIPLGRDSYYVSDIVEAFWLSKGIDGKVRRVNGSTATIKTNYPDYKGEQMGIIADYIKQIGWDPMIALQSKNTAIIFDNSISRERSQAAIISSAIIKRLKELFPKITEKQLQETVAILSTDNQDLAIRKETSWEQYSGKTSFLKSKYVNVFLGAKEFEKYMYDTTSEWHGSFSEFEVKNGVIVETPGYAHSEEDKKIVLWRMYEMLKTVTSKEFIENIEKEAKEYNVPLARLYQTGGSLFKTPEEFFEYQRRILEKKSSTQKSKIQSLNLMRRFFNSSKNRKKSYINLYIESFQYWLENNIAKSEPLLDNLKFIKRISPSQYNEILENIINEGRINATDLSRVIINLEPNEIDFWKEIFSKLNIDLVNHLLNSKYQNLGRIELDLISEMAKNNLDYQREKAKSDTLLNNLYKAFKDKISIVSNIETVEQLTILSSGNKYIDKMALKIFKAQNPDVEINILTLEQYGTLATSTIHKKLYNFFNFYSSEEYKINALIDLSPFAKLSSEQRTKIEEAKIKIYKSGKFFRHNQKVSYLSMTFSTDLRIKEEASFSKRVDKTLEYHFSFPKNVLESMQKIKISPSSTLLNHLIESEMSSKIDDVKKFEIAPKGLINKKPVTEVFKNEIAPIKESLDVYDRDSWRWKYNSNFSFLRMNIDYISLYENSDEIFERYLEFLVELKDKNYIYIREVRLLTAYILEKVKDTQKFSAAVKNNMDKSEYFKKAWSYSSAFESNNLQNGIGFDGQIKEKYQDINELITSGNSLTGLCGRKVFLRVSI